MTTKPPGIEELGSEPARMRARRLPCSGIGRFLLGLLLGAGLVAGGWALTAGLGGRPADLLRAPDGHLRVSYMVQDTPSSASGSTIEEVSAIEFHPSYIVVREKGGAGRVFFTERTRSLSWGVAGE